MQEPVEEEIVETEISLDEKEEESEVQKEDLLSNDSSSSTLTLFDYPPCLPKEDECYVPMDSLQISLFDKTDACYAYGHDVPMNETCGNNYATVIYNNPYYFDKSYDNPLFVPIIEMHGNKETRL